MAIAVLDKASILVNAVDLSAWTVSIGISDGKEEHDVTVFQNTARSFIGGLNTPEVKATFRQDFAAGGPHETLRGIVGTSVAVIVRYDGTAIRSGTNPEWAYTGVLLAYEPFGAGAHGAVPEFEVTFRPTGTPFTCLTTAT